MPLTHATAFLKPKNFLRTRYPCFPPHYSIGWSEIHDVLKHEYPLTSRSRYASFRYKHFSSTHPGDSIWTLFYFVPSWSNVNTSLCHQTHLPSTLLLLAVSTGAWLTSKQKEILTNKVDDDQLVRRSVLKKMKEGLHVCLNLFPLKAAN